MTTVSSQITNTENFDVNGYLAPTQEAPFSLETAVWTPADGPRATPSGVINITDSWYTPTFRGQWEPGQVIEYVCLGGVESWKPGLKTNVYHNKVSIGTVFYNHNNSDRGPLRSFPNYPTNSSKVPDDSLLLLADRVFLFAPGQSFYTFCLKREALNDPGQRFIVDSLSILGSLPCVFDTENLEAFQKKYLTEWVGGAKAQLLKEYRELTTGSPLIVVFPVSGHGGKTPEFPFHKTLYAPSVRIERVHNTVFITLLSTFLTGFGKTTHNPKSGQTGINLHTKHISHPWPDENSLLQVDRIGDFLTDTISTWLKQCFWGLGISIAKWKALRRFSLRKRETAEFFQNTPAKHRPLVLSRASPHKTFVENLYRSLYEKEKLSSKTTSLYHKKFHSVLEVWGMKIAWIRNPGLYINKICIPSKAPQTQTNISRRVLNLFLLRFRQLGVNIRRSRDGDIILINKDKPNLVVPRDVVFEIPADRRVGVFQPEFVNSLGEAFGTNSYSEQLALDLPRYDT